MLFDFRCPDGHIEEHWTTSDTRQCRCSCGKNADRVVSGTMPILDAISGDFPGATIKWARHHEQQAKAQSDA